MKKYLLLASVAALAFTSCSDQSTEFVGDEVAKQAQEITFSPIAKPTTRAEVEGTTFPAGQDMYVAAYDATATADFFGQTTFDDDGSSLWKANPPKYWPMNAATLNFLAYTGVPSGSYFNATHPAQDLTISLADNTSNQYDLMYACGRESRALNTAAGNVAMNFKHALALIKFEVKSAADYSYGTSPVVYPLVINSIVLTGAHYSGTYTIDNSSNYNSTSSTYSTLVGSWSSVSTQANVTRTPAFANITTSFQQVGAGILVVPDDNDATDDYTSFTINYTLQGNDYSYTYTPADLDVHQAKKYTFQITMTLNEIIIAPTVTDYVEENSNAFIIG